MTKQVGRYEDGMAVAVAEEIKALSADVAARFGALNERTAALGETASVLEQEVKHRLGGPDGLTSQKFQTLAIAVADMQARHDQLSRRLEQASMASARAGLTLPGETGDPAARFAMKQYFNQPRTEGHSGAGEGYDAYVKAFGEYLRWGGARNPDVAKALVIGNDTSGGYLVPEQMHDQIIGRKHSASPLRGLASAVAVSGPVLKVPVDWDDEDVDWEAENGSSPESDKRPFKAVAIETRRMTRRIVTSLEFLEDAATDVEGFIAAKLGNRFGRGEAAAFVSGSGVNKPRGFLTYAAGTGFGQIEQVESGTNGEVTHDGLINLLMSLKAPYQGKAVFAMNRLTLAQCMRLKDGEGRPLWLQSLSAGQPSLLLGRPVVQMDDMPVPGNDALAVALADWSEAYVIADRGGFRLIRDDYSKAPDVRFTAVQRVGGGVAQFEAIKLLKLTA